MIEKILANILKIIPSLNRETLRAKTFWIGIATVAWGGFLYYEDGPNTIATGAILGGLGMIAGRDAISKIK